MSINFKKKIFKNWQKTNIYQGQNGYKRIKFNFNKI